MNEFLNFIIRILPSSEKFIMSTLWSWNKIYIVKSKIKNYLIKLGARYKYLHMLVFICSRLSVYTKSFILDVKNESQICNVSKSKYFGNATPTPQIYYADREELGEEIIGDFLKIEQSNIYTN